MATKQIGQRVKILGGLREFVGQTGVIVDVEKDGRATMYRVLLDTPVEVGCCGFVEDDLWQGQFLRNIKG